ncbi:SRPBCC family protein [Pseudonocardia lacus]|uniref:SRPBCC family protein n=1 Tax=Pseudonocardia lacus TaxID=2835865 RepID=UPI001BDC7A40|nr:SRPBCC family protein [Pseudonocardia lacus]
MKDLARTITGALRQALVAEALVVGAVTAVAAAGVVLRRSRDWGALPTETGAPLPGDDLVPEPARTTTRAVNVDAPAAEVWRWLVQMGQGRGGMYSYDRLENAIGLDIHSADRVHEEWQDLAIGDRITVVPPGWGPLPDGYAMVVARIEPERVLVLRQSPPEHPWNAVWTFEIEPLDARSCRLLSRSRAQRPASRALGLATAAIEPVTTIMTRRMLLGVKQRAERAVWPDGRQAPPRPRPVRSATTVLDAPAGAS